jgi:hypothetical protein
VLRAAGGPVQERIDSAVAVLADELGMQIAFVSEFRAGQRVVTHTFEPGGSTLPIGTSHPEEETLCRRYAPRGRAGVQRLDRAGARLESA